MKVLLSTWMSLRGKATFSNLSRYSPLNEKTYARWFRRSFDFVEFNRRCLANLLGQDTRLIASMDCSFSQKSGRQTYGLGKCYSTTHRQAEKGLEISTLELVDVEYTTAYNLSTRLPLSTRMRRGLTATYSYLRHLKADRYTLPGTVRYRVTDGYYSKKKFTDGVVDKRPSSNWQTAP